MDPHTIDLLAAFAFMMFTVTAGIFVAQAWPLMNQAVRTLIAYEKLADTLNNEVPATLQEVRQITDRVKQLSTGAALRVSDVSHKVEEVSGSIGHVAERARHQSSVWGAGLFAGVKAYLLGKDHNEPEPEIRQITTDRGEQHVRQ